MHLRGATDATRGEAELTMWSQGGSIGDPDSGVAVRVRQGRLVARQGNGAWQEMGDAASDVIETEKEDQ